MLPNGIKGNAMLGERRQCSGQVELLDSRSEVSRRPERDTIKETQGSHHTFAPLVALAQVLDDFQSRLHVVPTHPF